MNSLLFLIILGFIIWFWQDSSRARELAIAKSRAYCQNYNYQLLDETVALASLRPCRNSKGSFIWLRQYRFEFSLDGYQRYNGTANLIGHYLLSIYLDHPHGNIIEDQSTTENTRH